MSSRLRAAIGAGVTAGVVMLACVMTGASRVGAGWASPLRWIAAFFGSEPALIIAGEASGAISTPAVITWGLVIHFATAVAWAWLFLLLTDSLSSLRGWRVALAGLIYGAAVWAIMTLAALRVFDDVMYARVQLLPGIFFGAHLLYGAALASYVGLVPKERLRFRPKLEK